MPSLPPVRLAGPTDRLAFAPQTASAARLAETLVAFANAQGGTLLVGVDKTGRPEGLADPEACRERAVQAALSTEPPLIIPLPRLDTAHGTALVEIVVPPGLPHVYSVQGKYLAREGTQNRPLSPRRLRVLMLERGAAGWETQVPEGAGLSDLDWEQAGRYADGLGTPAAGGAHEALLRRGCLARVEGELRPTCAGLLLFGHDPQRWVRSGGIMAARYPGRSMGDEFIKEEIRGTLPEQLRMAEAFVVGHMLRGVRLSGLERVEQTEYPVAVVREAIVNAVAHRDYQIGGDEIRVLLFCDRIEFYSPGRLPGHVTVENLLDERFSRNEIIVQVLSDMGFIERLGYGIDRIVRLMAEAGLPAPRFEETAAGFRVTLMNRPADSGGEPADTRRWRHLGLDERQERALGYLLERGRITNREFQELCPDVSSETIRRDLADLVGKGLLLKIGEKRATYYILK